MKKIIVLLLVLQIFLGLGNLSYGLDLKKETDSFIAKQSNFTFGLGWAGNEFLGMVDKNGLGYVESSYGINNFLGFSYTWVYGTPTNEAIVNAVDEVVKENGGVGKLGLSDLKLLTKKKLNVGPQSYFRLGTVYLLLPFVAQYGWMFPVGDIGRFQIGFGLPLLFNVGMNFDF